MRYLFFIPLALVLFSMTAFALDLNIYRIGLDSSGYVIVHKYNGTGTEIANTTSYIYSSSGNYIFLANVSSNVISSISGSDGRLTKYDENLTEIWNTTTAFSRSFTADDLGNVYRSNIADLQKFDENGTQVYSDTFTDSVRVICNGKDGSIFLGSWAISIVYKFNSSNEVEFQTEAIPPYSWNGHDYYYQFHDLKYDFNNDVIYAITYVNHKDGKMIIYKYNVSGSEVWHNEYYFGQAGSINWKARVDKDGNLIVAGSQYDTTLEVTKIAPDGSVLIDQQTIQVSDIFPSPIGDEALNFAGVEIDDEKNIYISGYYTYVDGELNTFESPLLLAYDENMTSLWKNIGERDYAFSLSLGNMHNDMITTYSETPTTTTTTTSTSTTTTISTTTTTVIEAPTGDVLADNGLVQVVVVLFLAFCFFLMLKSIGK